jgi:hypothetical protein
MELKTMFADVGTKDLSLIESIHNSGTGTFKEALLFPPSAKTPLASFNLVIPNG